MGHMWGELPLEGMWSLSKRTRECQIYHKKISSSYSCFRIETEFDFPPTLVFDYMRECDKRMSWDDGYESLKFVRQYPLSTAILNVIVKPQWPLGGREVLVLFQGCIHPETGSLYLACVSTEHPDFPPDTTGKLVRV